FGGSIPTATRPSMARRPSTSSWWVMANWTPPVGSPCGGRGGRGVRLRIDSFSAATAISFAHDRRRTCMTLAHIGGVPLEEMLLPIAAVGGSFLLNGLLGRPRRRRHPPEREDTP